MSHSKRNTSLAFFTNYERDQLKGRWGAQKARLTRESFLPLAACHLCLQTAREPVACRDGGHIFCKECAITNLLAQKKEIARLEREAEQRQDEENEAGKEQAEAAQDEAVKDFERTLNGLEPAHGTKAPKRKIDADAEDDRATSRLKTGDDKKSSQPFWMPSSTDSLATTKLETTTQRKSNPVCPSASSTNSHPLSLKAIVAVKFTTSSTATSDSNTATTQVNGKLATIICPACKKSLSASSKTMLTVPCGHVICKTCTDQFMVLKTGSSVGKHSTATLEDGPLVCYVCQTNLTDSKDKKKDKEGKKSKEKEKLRPGLVELATQGTGFAGAGRAVVDKEGIAFHFG